MKLRIISCVSLFLLCCFATYGQDTLRLHSPKYIYKGHEFLAGIGFPQGSSMSASGGYIAYNNQHAIGELYIKYRYHRSKKMSYGLTIAYENETGTASRVYLTSKNRYSREEHLGSFKKQVITFAPEMTLNYWDINHGMVRLYGTLGLGISYGNQIDTYDSSYYVARYVNGVNSLGNSMAIDNSRYLLNYYFSFLGVHVGREVGGFIEVGLGYKGLINVGMSYKF